MKEDLLQYIWQFQYFNNNELQTTSGEQIQIQFAGSHNLNQGPDFSGAKIKIGNTLWAGNVELHVNSSDWNLHKHSADSNFNNIILHVVWNHDTEIQDCNSSVLPTLELQSRVSKLLLDKYRELMNTSQFIPCENQVNHTNELTLAHWKQRLLAERLIAKSEKVLVILNQTNFHWEETFWRLIAGNFGLTVNSSFFQKIAESLPVKLLAKHKNNIHQIEALLFGQAGLLKTSFDEKYPVMLQKEFVFYKQKYKLQPVDGELFFLRMRPANFPTIRLAQLAVLIHESEHLFSKIKDASSVIEVKKMLDVTANDYWNYHYLFDEETGFKKKVLGSQMISNIIINTVVPVLFAFGVHHNEKQIKEKALSWLENIAAEKNAITKGFENLNFFNKNAFDSQALIQLKNEYCNKKRCLQCAIGNSLLKRSY
ncbi:MAG: DUF2851 family protein [Bacteroidota bacterium]|nr:DUF2851 family protein [Bacteroidota bacterium]